jgi:hypothetical protein
MTAVRWSRNSCLAIVAALSLAGCSSSHEPSAPSSPPGPSAPESGSSPGITPDGVTTSVNAPTSSTEEEYYRACRAAREWMSQKAGDPHQHVVPYLAMVQASSTGSDGTFGIPWGQMTPQRQAALIFAVNSAADGGCPE